MGFVEDPTLGVIDTPHSRVQFIQAFGLTTAEAEEFERGERMRHEIIADHRARNPMLVTDLGTVTAPAV